MAFYITLSKEENLHFSFDEKRLYRDGQPAPHLLENLPFEIFKYLAECSPNHVSHQDIVEEIWEKRLKKAPPMADPSEAIKMHIMSIRKYLGDTFPFKYIESGYKSYKCNFESVLVDYHHFDAQVSELNQNINDLVVKLEDIQNRITNSSNEKWKEIYTAQFNSTYVLFLQTKYNLDSFVSKYKDIYPPDQSRNIKAVFCKEIDEVQSEEALQNMMHCQKEIKNLNKVIDDLFVTYPPDEIFPKND